MAVIKKAITAVTQKVSPQPRIPLCLVLTTLSDYLVQSCTRVALAKTLTHWRCYRSLAADLLVTTNCQSANRS